MASQLPARIQADLVSAMKRKDELALSTIRMLKSALQLAQVEKGKDVELTDEEVVSIVRRLIKQREESAAMYRSAGAEERALAEEAEIKVIDVYLPVQLTDEELSSLVSSTIESLGASGPRDMGRVMSAAMESVKGRADGKRVRALVQSTLEKLAQ